MAIKFLNTVAVDTNVLYVDAINNRVGIGTNNPDAKLSVSDDGQAVFEILPFTNDYGTTLRSYDTVDETFNYLSYKASIHTFYIGDAAKVRIDSSGNVGIGTTSPSAFDALADNFVINAATSAGMTISESTGAGTSNILFAATSSFANRGNITYDHTATAMSFGINASEKMRITSSGNVGIGTTSPTAKLSVENSSSSIVADFKYSAAGYSSIDLSNNVSFARLSSVNSDLLLSPAGSEKMRVTSSGNVGIGTTSPGATLHVKNAVGSYPFIVETPYDRVGKLISTDAGAELIIQDSGSTDNGNSISVSGDTMTLRTANSNRIRILANGNVGIGTTSPTAKLHLEGDAIIEGVLRADNVNLGLGGAIKVKASNTASDQYVAFGTTPSGSSGNATFTEKMRVTSAGNVGIGTTSPGSSLHIGDGSSAETISIQTGNSNDAKIAFLLADGTERASFKMGGDEDLEMDWNSSDNFIWKVGGLEKARFDGSGNLGIGTTSPTTKLEVAGTITSTGNLTAYNANPSINIGHDGNSAYIAAGMNASGGNSPIVFSIGNNNVAAKIIANGNVGIGTTNPSAPLSLGNGGAESLEFNHNISSSSRILSYNRSNNTYRQLQLDALEHIFKTSSSEKMRITSTGNVGIGTTSPDGKLEIVQTSGGGTPTLIVANDPSGSDGFTFQSWRYNESNTNFRLDLKQRVSSGVVQYAFDMVNNGVGYNSTLVLDRGKVGIGTTSPGANLDIKSTGNAVLMQAYSAGYKAMDLWGATNGAQFSLYGGTSSSTITIDGRPGYNSVINNGGNFGIGTTSPVAKLDVAGDLRIDGYSTTTNEAGLYLYNNISYSMASLANCNSNYNAFRIRGRNTATNTLAIGSNGNSDYVLQVVNDAGTVSGNISINPYGGNVGIGTASPLEKLEVQGTVYATPISYAANQSAYALKMGASNNTAFDMGIKAKSTSSGGPYMSFCSSNTEDVIVVQNSNVGINTASPSYNLDVSGTGRFTNTLNVNSSALAAYIYSSQSIGLRVRGGGNSQDIAQFQNVGGSTVAVIDSGGDVGIGTSAPGSRLTVVAPSSGGATAVDFQISGGGGYGMTNLGVEIPGYGNGIKVVSPTSSGTDNTAMSFYQQTSTVGSITIGTSSTSFNTTSDYRLKENREDISDAIERVKELKPIKFNWIKEPGESKVDGFYAHELAEVVPEAVTGEKDALDWEGKPDYQAIDQAKIVPLLTAALQQAIDKIEALELRINKLEKQ